MWWLVTVCGHCMWSLYVVTECGHCMWTLHVVTVCGHCMWSLYVVTVCGHCMWSLYVVTVFGHFMLSLYVVTVCGHCMWSLYVVTVCDHCMWSLCVVNPLDNSGYLELFLMRIFPWTNTWPQYLERVSLSVQSSWSNSHHVSQAIHGFITSAGHGQFFASLSEQLATRSTPTSINRCCQTVTLSREIHTQHTQRLERRQGLRRNRLVGRMLKWTGHVERMGDVHFAKRTNTQKVEGKRGEEDRECDGGLG